MQEDKKEATEVASQNKQADKLVEGIIADGITRGNKASFGNTKEGDPLIAENILFEVISKNTLGILIGKYGNNSGKRFRLPYEFDSDSYFHVHLHDSLSDKDRELELKNISEFFKLG